MTYERKSCKTKIERGKTIGRGKGEAKAEMEKYWKRMAGQKLLAQREHHTFRRPSHCILFLFCANNRWALSLFLSHEWSMPVRSGIVRTPSIYESSHSSPVTMLIFFFFFFFLLLFVVIYTADALIKESPNRRLLRAAFFCKASFSFPFRSPSLRRFYLYLRHGLSVSLVSPRITNNSISIIHKLNEEC